MLSTMNIIGYSLMVLGASSLYFYHEYLTTHTILAYLLILTAFTGLGLAGNPTITEIPQ